MTPRTALPTTKHTKHTKNEPVRVPSWFTWRVGASVLLMAYHFVSLVSFVVATVVFWVTGRDSIAAWNFVNNLRCPT